MRRAEAEQRLLRGLFAVPSGSSCKDFVNDCHFCIKASLNPHPWCQASTTTGRDVAEPGLTKGEAVEHEADSVTMNKVEADVVARREIYEEVLGLDVDRPPIPARRSNGKRASPSIASMEET